MKPGQDDALSLEYGNTNPQPPWDLSKVFMVVFFTFFVVPYVGDLLIAKYAVKLPQFRKDLIHQFLFYISLVLIYLGFQGEYGADLKTYLGLRKEKGVLYYLTAGLFCGILIYLFGLLLGIVAHRMGWPVESYYANFPKGQAVILMIVAIVFTPTVEEVLHRGFIQASLYRYMPDYLAVIAPAAFFTVLHTQYYGNWLALGYVSLMALALGLVRLATGSTLPCIVAHLANNLITLLITLSHWPA